MTRRMSLLCNPGDSASHPANQHSSSTRHRLAGSMKLAERTAEKKREKKNEGAGMTPKETCSAQAKTSEDTQDAADENIGQDRDARLCSAARLCRILTQALCATHPCIFHIKQHVRWDLPQDTPTSMLGHLKRTLADVWIQHEGVTESIKNTPIITENWSSLGRCGVQVGVGRKRVQAGPMQCSLKERSGLQYRPKIDPSRLAGRF